MGALGRTEANRQTVAEDAGVIDLLKPILGVAQCAESGRLLIGHQLRFEAFAQLGKNRGVSARPQRRSLIAILTCRLTALPVSPADRPIGKRLAKEIIGRLVSRRCRPDASAAHPQACLHRTATGSRRL